MSSVVSGDSDERVGTAIKRAPSSLEDAPKSASTTESSVVDAAISNVAAKGELVMEDYGIDDDSIVYEHLDTVLYRKAMRADEFFEGLDDVAAGYTSLFYLDGHLYSWQCPTDRHEGGIGAINFCLFEAIQSLTGSSYFKFFRPLGSLRNAL